MTLAENMYLDKQDVLTLSHAFNAVTTVQKAAIMNPTLYKSAAAATETNTTQKLSAVKFLNTTVSMKQNTAKNTEQTTTAIISLTPTAKRLAAT